MKILLVDDDPNSRESMTWILKHMDHDVTECINGEEAFDRLTGERYPMVLSDIQMPGMSGNELAAKIKQLPDGWQTDVVLFTGHAALDSAVSALRAGVYDYLEKPINLDELESVIDRVAEHQALLRENRVWTERFAEEVKAATEEKTRELVSVKKMLTESMIGSVGIFSQSMQEIFAKAELLHKDRSIPVLIEGETGTGKDVLAKVIHYGQKFDAQSAGAFVDINCAALVPTLFESELFGYEAGAFTGGTTKGAKGKFDLAREGTLFFDEIGEIPLDLQGKLLRVLQEKEFYRVGGLRKLKTDIRAICATNVSLTKCVEEGNFRRDLYYRLKVAHIVVPPLRKRQEEIVPLAELFLTMFSRRKKKQFTTIDQRTKKLLEEYSWPGNIRELQNVIEYAVFAYDDNVLKCEHVIELLTGGAKSNKTQGQPLRSIEIPLPEQGYSLKNYTEDLIRKLLVEFDGNQNMVANYLGISRRALNYRVGDMADKEG